MKTAIFIIGFVLLCTAACSRTAEVQPDISKASSPSSDDDSSNVPPEWKGEADLEAHYAPGLHLYVTNQSPNVDPVDVKVTMGDRTIFDMPVPFNDAHWYEYVKVKVTPGTKYLLQATSTDGKATAKFTFKANRTNWIVVTYWYYTDEDTYGPVERKLRIEKRDDPFSIQ